MGRIGICSSIVLGNPKAAGWAVAFLVIFLVLLLLATVRSPLPSRWKWSLFALRGVAITLLGLCLLDPQFSRRRVKPGENIFALLADQSASLELRQAASSAQSRGDHIKSLLANPDLEWQKRLGQDFDIRRYTFGATIGGVENFQELEFKDPASNLGNGLKTLENRYRGQALAGIMLFTDGNSTDEIQDLKDSGIRIFPIVNDQSPELNDLAIRNVSVSQTNFEDAPVTIQATVSSCGNMQGKVKVTLQEEQKGETPQPVESQTLSLNSSGEVAVRFQVRPKRSGAIFYRLAVVSENEPDALTKPETSQEATLQNNRQQVAVNRDSHVSRILYIGGRPNWEHKFLGRALAEDDQLQLVSLVRIARKEAKFDFRGRVGEGSNPLFRGFKGQSDEETEDYSQPVVVRLNTKDQKELSDGFPKTKKELYQYDAIIIDDMEAAFFTRDQQTLIDKFVAERGGGLLMLGGRESFRHGKWDHTPVADALPVYVSRNLDPLHGKLKWQLTREGWLEPWTRSRDTEKAEQSRLAQAAPLGIVSSDADLKPGARVLAIVQDEQGRTTPSLVTQAYGQGRTGALLIGDLWRWGMQDKGENEAAQKEDDAGKFWRQFTRWLVGDVPRRLSASVESTKMGGLPATVIRVQVRDDEYQLLDGERIQVTVTQPDGTEVKLDAQPSLEAAGTYEAVHVSRQAGAYVAAISTDATGTAPLTTQVGWASDPSAEEFQQINVNLPALTRLAAETQGEVIKYSELDRKVADFKYRDLPVMETETSPLWHQPWFLFIALAMLSAEWGLRRWKGLA